MGKEVIVGRLKVQAGFAAGYRKENRGALNCWQYMDQSLNHFYPSRHGALTLTGRTQSRHELVIQCRGVLSEVNVKVSNASPTLSKGVYSGRRHSLPAVVFASTPTSICVALAESLGPWARVLALTDGSGQLEGLLVFRIGSSINRGRFV